MAFFLLNADRDIFPPAMAVLCLPDRKVDRLALIVAVAHHTALFVHDVPTIKQFVVVNVNSVF